MLASACNGGGQAAPPPKVGLSNNQTLTFPIGGDFTTLDPAVIDTPSDAEIAQNLFDGLVRIDANMDVVPEIAAAMPAISSDGLTYTFKLRPDVTFSNGDKLTSKDVLYSWNRAAAMQGSYAPNLSAIAGYAAVSNNQAFGPGLETLLEKKDPSVTMSGLRAPDDQTVVVKLSSAAGWFLSAIAQPSVVGMIVDENVVRTNFDNWWATAATLVGTGAYRMTAHTPGKSIDFAQVSGWWGSPKPTVTQVHLDIPTSASAAIATYERGGYDLYGYDTFSPPVSDAIRIQATAGEKGQVVRLPHNATFWVSFNLVSDRARAGGPFTLNLGSPAHDLRLAFDLAIDKSALAKLLCQDVICVPATGGLIPKGLIGYLGDGVDPLAAFDPLRAKALLDAADPGGSNTKGLVYAYDTENPLNEPTARFLQSQWLDNLGVSVKLQPLPRSSFITLRLKGRFILARDGWRADYNDPQDWFDNLWGRLAGCPDLTCTSGYDTAAYDSLLAKADSEPLAAATDDYAALSRQLIDAVGYIPLYYTVSVYLVKPYVKGAGANNLFDYLWDQVQIESH
jgi:oligopeptide transport system substrate-binding protein